MIQFYGFSCLFVSGAHLHLIFYSHFLAFYSLVIVTKRMKTKLRLHGYDEYDGYIAVQKLHLIKHLWLWLYGQGRSLS